MKFGFGKRIAGFVLAAAVAAGTFLSTPATAKAAALAKGIDVSKYQGRGKLSAVKNAGYSFCVHKGGKAKSGLDVLCGEYGGDCSWYEGRRLHLFRMDNRPRDDGNCGDGAYSVAIRSYGDLEDSIHKTCSSRSLAALTVAFAAPVTAGRLLSDGLFQQKLDGRQDRGNPMTNGLHSTTRYANIPIRRSGSIPAAVSLRA